MGIIGACTIQVFHVLAGRLKQDTRESQYRLNRIAWREYRKKIPGSYLENQPALTGFLYGVASKTECRIFFRGLPLTAARNSCEVIATYNALIALGDEKSYPELLYEYSGDGICFKGIFGTDPLAIYRYFKNRGYDVTEYRGSRIETLKDEDDGAAYIYTAFNRGYNPFHMVHTLCVTKEGDSFRVHNGFIEKQPYPDPLTAMKAYNNGMCRTIYVLKIRKNDGAAAAV